MRLFLCLPEDASFLAARWLGAQPEDSEVWLLHAPESEGDARALQGAFKSIKHIRAIQKVLEEPEAEAVFQGARITLPLTPDEFPLRYQFPVRVPDYRPQAALLRDLWQLGFREVETWHAGGSKVLPLQHQLHEFKNIHAGKRCFIVGNGPSLNKIDMRKISGEITFSANRGYLGYDRWGFCSHYWGVYDPLQVEAYCGEYECNVPDSCIKFFPLQYWPLLRMQNTCPVLLDWPRRASREFSNAPDRLFVGYSVVYMLMQIAAVMGCNPIILIGMDHRYHLTKNITLMRMMRLAGRWMARKHDQRLWYRCGHAAYREYFKLQGKKVPVPASRLWQAKDAVAETHFDSTYTSEKKQFLMPRPLDAEADYRCALAWAQAQGVEILNATPDSALTIFPMVKFESLF